MHNFSVFPFMAQKMGGYLVFYLDCTLHLRLSPARIYDYQTPA